jgi:hypothetical protein
MRYTVVWRDRASADMLAQLLRAADKQEVLAAGRQMERQLSRRPRKAGESRSSMNLRLAFFRPLTALYTVDPASRKVVVERVTWVGM